LEVLVRAFPVERDRAVVLELHLALLDNRRSYLEVSISEAGVTADPKADAKGHQTDPVEKEHCLRAFAQERTADHHAPRHREAAHRRRRLGRER